MADKRIKVIRLDANLTQADMAAALGVTQGAYARHEKADWIGTPMPQLWRRAINDVFREKAGASALKPEVEQLPIGYTCGAAEFNAMKGQRGQWSKLQGTYTKTAMEAETSNTTKEG